MSIYTHIIKTQKTLTSQENCGRVIKKVPKGLNCYLPGTWWYPGRWCKVNLCILESSSRARGKICGSESSDRHNFRGRTAHLGVSNRSGGVKGTLFLFIQGFLADQGKFPQMGKGCRLCCRLL